MYPSNMPGRVNLITPSDVTEHSVLAGLRVANKSAAWATIATKQSNLSPGSPTGNATVTFDVAPGSVDYLPGQFKMVLATGTTVSVDVIIHGFQDPKVF